MKSALLAFALLLFNFAAAISAQDVSSSIKWTRFQATEEGFSVEVPETYKYNRDQVLGRFNEGRGEYLSDGLYLYAFVDRVKESRQYEIVDGFVKANRQMGSVENVDGQQITRYEFEGSDRYFHTVVLGKSETRSYAFHAVSRTARNPFVARFIKSIKFGPPPVDPSMKPESEPKPEAIPDDLELDLETVSSGPVADPSPGSGSGLGATSGAGVGPGSGTPKAENVPLRILSKQKARYTDLARFYNIMGTVTLRVTFMSDNTIGSITTIKTLPFGLTESAIAAARNMRFQAEIVNGQPRNTSRPVSFLFTIY